MGKLSLNHRKQLHNYVKNNGGMHTLYEGFVNYFKQEGFDLKEVNKESLYLHYGTQKGKVGIQIIQTGVDEAMILLGIETREGYTDETRMKVKTESDQIEIAEKLISLFYSPRNDQNLEQIKKKKPKTLQEEIKENSDFWWDELERTETEFRNKQAGLRKEQAELVEKNKAMFEDMDRLKEVSKLPNYDESIVITAEEISPIKSSQKIKVKFVQWEKDGGTKREAYLKAFPEEYIKTIPSIQSYIVKHLNKKERVYAGVFYPIFETNGKKYLPKIRAFDSYDATSYQHQNLRKTARKNGSGHYLVRGDKLIFRNYEVVIKNESDSLIKANGSVNDPTQDAKHKYNGKIWIGNKIKGEIRT